MLVLLLALAAGCAHGEPKPEIAAPYVPTPWAIVDEIMKLAAIGPGDFVVDLGSGDGRLVVTAVARYGARGGFGVDIDPSLVALANENAAKEGVASRVRFIERDLFATDVSQASVVTLYLLPTTIPKLEPKLLRELRPGARVVSHDYAFPTWVPDRDVEMNVLDKIRISGTERTVLYLYVVPAHLEGVWALELPGSNAGRAPTLTLRQSANNVHGEVTIGTRRLALRNAAVTGENVTLSLPPDAAGGRTLTLRGKASGDTMQGELAGGEAWRARRVR